ncbi:PREDICTED: protein transport protein Sec61 subunit beta isoform X3 [Colobus angolensis palliatus]|uniref:protein transport protein Sec61 subunit beta isoform X3 n=1 Tax=Colobus angolensis palliatus TaxID=336983 RepID=UPI0005F36162|nr:PREDICTED: protein transport protein Sec61 subunit beta isoform X3 [Colobus angolensis palliatus]
MKDIVIQRKEAGGVYFPHSSLVRPPVVLTWDPQGALPAKPWPPERRDPLSGRGKMPAVGQGVQAARPQQAPGGCGDSTQKIHLGSKLALFQYWL